MKRIAIVGAGQAGLQLGIGLVDAGYAVTLFSNRTPEDVLHGKPMSLPTLFDDALQIERNLKLNFWDDRVFGGERISVNLCDPDGNLALVVSSSIEKRWQSLDQRLKFSSWMQEFVHRGGELVIRAMTLNDLEDCVQNYDLVVVAVGKGILSTLFERDAQRSSHDKPQRHLAGVIVTGLKGDKTDLLTTKGTLIPSVGEIFQFPYYDKGKGNSHAIYFECCPGGAMDQFTQVQSGRELLELSKKLIQQLTLWDYEAVKDMELTDDKAWLCGAITPTVRKPVGRLPSGATVMGIGDTVIVTDPIVAQGANNAAKMAHLVTQRIIEHGNRSFDAEWIQAVFDEFWAYSQYVNALVDCMLMPQAPQQDIMVAAAQNPDVARDFFNGFNHPPSLFPWYFVPEETKKYLAQKNATATGGSSERGAQTGSRRIYSDADGYAALGSSAG